MFFFLCTVTCLLTDGKTGQVSNAVRLHVGLLSFSWDHEFKVLNEGPFPAIMGLDFLLRTHMRVDLLSCTFSFAFAPNRAGSFSPSECGEGSEPFLQQLRLDAAELTTITQVHPEDLSRKVLMNEFPHLFSLSLSTAKCAPYDTELLDSKPVRSPPYRCAPPRLQIFKQIVDELLVQGVVRPRPSTLALHFLCLRMTAVSAWW